MKKSFLKKVFSFDIGDWIDTMPSYEGVYFHDRIANAASNISSHLMDANIAYDEIVVTGHDVDYSQTAKHSKIFNEILAKAKKLKYIIYNEIKENSAREYLSKTFPGKNEDFEIIAVSQEKFDAALNAVAQKHGHTLAFIALEKNQKNNHWMIFKNNHNPVAMWVENKHRCESEKAKNCYFLTSPKATGVNVASLKSNSDYQVYQSMTDELTRRP